MGPCGCVSNDSPPPYDTSFGCFEVIYMARHDAPLTPHTSHLTPHTSHLTPHTSHLTPRADPFLVCAAVSTTQLIPHILLPHLPLTRQTAPRYIRCVHHLPSTHARWAANCHTLQRRSWIQRGSARGWAALALLGRCRCSGTRWRCRCVLLCAFVCVGGRGGGCSCCHRTANVHPITRTVFCNM